jgi:iron complex transport system ATP-binding protein
MMEHHIFIENLSFGYHPGDPVFSHVCLHIDKGSVFCLLGPNGSGKSTLIKCMVNLLSGFHGIIRVDGESIRSMKPAQIASKIGYVPQSLAPVFPFSVEEIVVMGRASKINLISTPSRSDRGKAAEAMERIGVRHLSKRPCNRLSGGEWQLVLIARALTQSPGILVLDEPTSHLDLGNQVRILEVVDSLSKQGITIVMASHFPDHAFLNADQVGILKNGAMDVLGDPETVLCEKVLKETYNIKIHVVRLGAGINRNICVPVLNRSKGHAA